MATTMTVKSIPAKRLKIKLGERVLGSLIMKTPFPIVEDHSQPIISGYSGDPSERSCVADREKRGWSEAVDNDRPRKRQKATEDESMRHLCSDLLRTLMEDQYGWVFSRPVDPKALNLPDYLSVISEPMDLGTIKSRLENQEYVRAEDFGRDVRLTFYNAMMYAGKSSKIHRMAAVLLQIFEARWNVLVKGAHDENPEMEIKLKSVRDGSKESSEASSKNKASRAEILENRFKDATLKAQTSLGRRKRIIEKERETARIALNQLEKTVDLEDNIRYEKELEQLCRYNRRIYKLEYFGLFLKDLHKDNNIL